MRLVYTAPRYHTNQHFSVQALVEAGHSVSFLVLRRGQSETYDALEPNVLGRSPIFDVLLRLVGRCPGVNFERTLGLPPLLRFWREMRGLRPAAVIVRDPFSAYGMLSTLTSRLIGARPIFYSQAPKYRRLSRWKRFVFALARRAAGAEWITPVLGSPGLRGSVDTHLRYAPFVIRPQTAPGGKRWFAGGVVNILSVGKYEARKNHGLFLDVIGRLSRRHSIRATIVGECSTSEHRLELERVRRHCQRLDLEGTVGIEVNLPFPEVQRRYSEHDVFVLASRDEWAAVSPLEAMAHSLPVACSDSNGTQCYVRPGENGFVFRSDDLDDLEACLSRIVSDRERLVEMGRRSHELVVSEHAPERYVEAVTAMAGGTR